MSEVIVIDGTPPTRRERLSRWLRQRMLVLAAVLAGVEVLWVLIWRSSTILMAVLAFVILVLAIAGATRLAPGPLRDILWIVALAQAIVVAIPLLIGVSFVLAVLVAAILIVGLVIFAMARWRR